MFSSPMVGSLLLDIVQKVAVGDIHPVLFPLSGGGGNGWPTVSAAPQRELFPHKVIRRLGKGYPLPLLDGAGRSPRITIYTEEADGREEKQGGNSFG